MSKIRLLDKKEHNTKVLLKRMYNDKFYYGDLNLLALSSSSIKLLHESQKNITIIQSMVEQKVKQ